jgi:uncharacterized protein YndB with AHSA1/START domain
MYSTRASHRVAAPRSAVYRALVDAEAIARWRVPAGMSSHVHTFEAREGGAFRVSLSYDAATGTGKSAEHTDTYHGRFLRLVPDEQVVEELAFETADPAMSTTMTMTTTSCSCTRAFRTACRSPTTSWAPGWPSRTSRSSSRGSSPGPEPAGLTYCWELSWIRAPAERRRSPGRRPHGEACPTDTSGTVFRSSAG